MAPTGLELVVVDAFTDSPFRGNPAAVCVVEEPPGDAVLQMVARELQLSETAFCVPRADGDHDLRWFTPTTEVDLCGHATLAAAHVLGGRRRFHTRSGVLSCAPAEGGWIEMDFPSDPVEEIGLERGPDLGPLGPRARHFARGREDALVELDAAAAVRDLVVSGELLGAVAALGTRALIVTAQGDRPGLDCVSRVFGPNVGIPEDPVTGSAHCTLADYWGRRLDREHLTGEQASPRGGTVRMRRRGARVILGGQAVVVSQVRFSPEVLTAVDGGDRCP